MAQKENKGGVLSNDQIEQDNKVKGKAGEKESSYAGSQDTGDDIVRPLGSEVQRQDGVKEEEKDQ